MSDRMIRLLDRLGRLPWPLAHGLGYLLGLVLGALPLKGGRIADANLAVCLPHLPAWRRRLLRLRSFGHLGCILLESRRIWRADAAGIGRLVHRVEGEAVLRAAIGRGRGVLVVTPHLGGWEVLNQYLASRYPLTTLYRPQRGALEDHAAAGRRRLGAQLVPTTAGGVRALRRALARGELVGMLPDQDISRGGAAGLFVRYFGQQAHTPVLPARLAASSGAAVVMAVARRRLGRGFDLTFSPVGGVTEATSAAAGARALNAALERVIVALPAQYWWSYPRFRRRPPGVASIYGRDGRRFSRAATLPTDSAAPPCGARESGGTPADPSYE